MLIIILIISILSLALSLLAFLKISRNDSSEKLKENNAEIIDSIKKEIEKSEENIDKNFTRNREENLSIARNNREEINNSFKNFNESILQNFSNLAKIQTAKLEEFARQLLSFEDKFVKNANENRIELTRNLQEFEQNQKKKFDEFFDKNNQMRLEIEQKLEQIRQVVENKLQFLQEDNSTKLEKMRLTVEEKLQETVEKRFDQSFKIIGDRLDQVHKGLGEMQTLANGVGDLKKVLSNVKIRGNIGEIQLGAILEQFFSSAQYEKNAVIKPQSTQRVEFAIKIPSKDSDEKFLLLPIDSKFPIEDYQRLTEIYESFDASNQQLTKAAVDQARRQFESAVKKAAKDICDKYLNPPLTTDFGIMFVPTEGLYAEILRNNSLFEEIQKTYRVVILGPTTIVAFLSALQMGFRTLEVEKRSSEVWRILGKVKNEFSKFGDVLEGVKKKMEGTMKSIDEAAVRSRAIEKNLKDVEISPSDNQKPQDLLESLLDIDDET